MSDIWTYRLTKRDATPLAEVHNAFERKYTANLSKPSTAAFVVRKDNAILPYLFDSESKFLEVWQNDALRFWGPIISSNFAMSEGAPPSIAVTAADPAWFLTRRLSGKSEKGTTYASTDKALAAAGLIGENNVETGDSWTNVAPHGDTCGSIGTYTAGPYKATLSCIQELAHGTDGFDWYIEPHAGEDFGSFRAAAVVGSEKPKAIFEYGTGRKNMRSMNYLRDISTEVNVAYQIADEGPIFSELLNPHPVVSNEDSTSIGANGRLEEVVELSGINSLAIREEWVEANVKVRKDPRRVLGMTSDIDDGSDRVPKFGTDYWLGDLVTARAAIENQVLFNGITRVYAMELSLDNAGVASVTPILVEEAEE